MKATYARHAVTEEEALDLAAFFQSLADESEKQPSPERALPILKKVLGGQQSTLVKRRALFVLSQIDTPEAQTLLVDTARAGDPALRAEAIRNIGISGNPSSLAVLQTLYEGGDARTKKEVLQAWLISGRKNEVYQAALNAKSEEEANNAIRTLSVMGARDELRKLGETRQPNEHLAEAYAISGDLESLRRIAEGNGELSMRRDAVRKIGIVQSPQARTALREIYHNWTGTAWFIEGDIQACFDSLDHSVLEAMLAEHIHDNRFLRLLRELLRAGYLEAWIYHRTLSGAPQGSIATIRSYPWRCAVQTIRRLCSPVTSRRIVRCSLGRMLATRSAHSIRQTPSPAKYSWTPRSTKSATITA